MNKYGITYDYVETAIRIVDSDHDAPGSVVLYSDHACSPRFYHTDAGRWQAVQEKDGWRGLVAEGMCEKCDQRALLRIPQHLVMAMRLGRRQETAC